MTNYQSTMTIEDYATAVSILSGVAVMGATMGTIEACYMNGDTVAEGAAALKAIPSSEIGAYNRKVMFGENDEAFPEADEWSLWVD